MESQFYLVDTEDTYCYRVEGIINNSKYRLDFNIYFFNNSLSLYITLGSGKKRKELSMSSLEKVNKSDGGLRVLAWCKQRILQFKDEYKGIVKNLRDGDDVYLIVQWENKRLREIYKKKLKDVGFYMTYHCGTKCLKLKVR